MYVRVALQRPSLMHMRCLYGILSAMRCVYPFVPTRNKALLLSNTQV